MFVACKDLNAMERISINDAEKGNNYFCPHCKKRLLVVLPLQKKAYFSHYPNESCIDYWKYDESDWANRWKSRFDINNVEYDIVREKEHHHIDANIKNRLALMFQTGTMKASLWREKTDYILHSGFSVLWLLNFTDYLRSGRIRRGSNPNILIWNKPSAMFENYQNRLGVYVVLQLGNDDSKDDAVFAVLKQIDLIYQNQRIYVQRWLTREQYVQYYNDIADGKDPEEPYRIAEELKEKELAEKRLRFQQQVEEQRRQAEKRMKELLAAEDERRRRREEEERKRQEEYRRKQEAYFARLAEKQKREEEERLEEEKAMRLEKEMLRAREEEENRERERKAAEERVKECIYTIEELWNLHNPHKFLTVENINQDVYRIERNPSMQMYAFKCVYGLPKGKRTGEPSERIPDADKKIWKYNYHR